MRRFLEPLLALSYLIRKSQSRNIRHNKQCAVNLSTLELVVGIGNCIGLTAQHGSRVPALRWRPGDEHGPFLWDVVKGPHYGRAQDSADRALPRQRRIHGVVTRSLTTQPLQTRTSARRCEAIRAARFMRPGKGGGAKPPSLFCPWRRRWVGVLGCGCGCGGAGFGGARWPQHGAGQPARRQRSLQAELRCRGRDRRRSVRRG